MNFLEFHTIDLQSENWKSNLLPCTKYLIGITLDNTTIPMNLLRLRTDYDSKEAPTIITEILYDDSVQLTWDHSCRFFDEYPQYYLIRKHDLILNITTYTYIYGRSFSLGKVAKGAKYEIGISTSIDNAEMWNFTYEAPPLPQPKIEYMAMQNNGRELALNWTTVVHDESK